VINLTVSRIWPVKSETNRRKSRHGGHYSPSSRSIC